MERHFGKTMEDKMKYKNLLHFFEGEGEGTGSESVQDAAEQETEETTEEKTPEDLDAEFETMIKGKFKDQYHRRFQTAMDQRHKDYKQLQENAQTMSPVMDMLKAKYGVSELGELQNAILNDDSYYEQEAMQRGMSVEQLKYMKQIERENTQYKMQQEEYARQQAVRERTEQWRAQEEALRKEVPELDIRNELENPEFQRLLTSGVDMRTAYQVVHMDEIMSGAMGYAAKKATEKTVKGIQARGMRPDELGLSKQQGDSGRKSIADMSGDEILELAEKAKREGTVKW